MVKLKVWAGVGETEDETKVNSALKNLFGEVEFKLVEGKLQGKMEHTCLNNLKHLARVKQIQASIFGQLSRNDVDGKTKLFLNKQAAFAGKFSLVQNYEDSPLGAIVVEFNWDAKLFKWLTGLERNQLD
ncbi:MAG: hypothetical protein GOV01_03290 [Candidatus Altiarchaeota archaeon]|nr:hypothetical protein [Candidatus Altiarchaeota archaeon]